jgi:hypothetical protein
MFSRLLVVADVAEYGAVLQGRFAAETIGNDMVEVKLDAVDGAASFGLALTGGALEGVSFDLFGKLPPHRGWRPSSVGSTWIMSRSRTPKK